MVLPERAGGFSEYETSMAEVIDINKAREAVQKNWIEEIAAGSFGLDKAETSLVLQEVFSKYGLANSDLDAQKAERIKSVLQLTMGGEDTKRVLSSFIAENIDRLRTKSENLVEKKFDWRENIVSFFTEDKKDEIRGALSQANRELNETEATRLKNLIQLNMGYEEITDIVNRFFSEN